MTKLEIAARLEALQNERDYAFETNNPHWRNIEDELNQLAEKCPHFDSKGKTTVFKDTITRRSVCEVCYKSI